MTSRRPRANLLVTLATCAATVFAGVPARADDSESAQQNETQPKAPAAAAAATAELPTSAKATFAADPIADGAIIVSAAAFAGILDLINGTGELRPQQVSPTFDRSRLLGIDRGAISQTPDPAAKTASTIGLIAAAGYAALDPILSGIREKNVQAALVDATIYAEALTLTWGATSLTKIAVRRPRPQAYIDAEAHKGDPNYFNSDTDSSLSFFSGHASITASVSATATYLAFVRSPGTARPWVTLGAGTALTTFVSIERVRGAAHFPTDVVAGAIVGAGIGLLVAHLHRNEDAKQRRVWVGFSPERAGGGVAQLGGVF